jgi:signal transduction histidine kinase
VGELNLGRVLERVAELARELLEARYAAIGLLAPDHQTLASFTTAGLTDEPRERIGPLPTGRGVLGLVIKRGQVVRLKDLTKHSSAVGYPPDHPPMHSFLGVPVVGRSGVLGDLYLTEKIGAEEFTDDDVHLALLLASIVASAVENARYYEQTAQLLDEVQQLQRSRERFFAMVNHELRNSLAGVYGWAELMVRKKDPQSVPRGAFEILEGAEQATALVNDLLDLNRLDEDRLKPVVRDVDCCQLVRSSMMRVTPAAEEKEVTFVAPEPEPAMLCRTDRHRVEQILVNLFTNAIRHTPAGSAITITLTQDARFVEFTVLDEGPGVKAEDADRIFDIYFTTAGDEGGGHGVGLPLSRRLARLLGGDLNVVPQPGAGGRFVLRVPAVES